MTEMRPGRRDIARAGVLVSYTVDSRLVGVVAVNAPQAFTAMTRSLMANVPQIDERAAASTGTARPRTGRRLHAVA